MTITPAETRCLNLIAAHGKAIRDLSARYYVWKINGQAKGGKVDDLIRKGVLSLSPDKSTATLSAKGRAIVNQERKAA